MNYDGIKEVTFSHDEMANFYQHMEVPEGMLENQYLLVRDSDGAPVDNYIIKNGKLEKVGYLTFYSSFCGKLKPRNPEQIFAWDLLKREDIPIKLLTGKFGVGKSLAIINAAMEALEKNKFDKIIFIRNNVQVKATDPLGALPGSLYDKTVDYLMPFADHCGGVDGIKALMEQDKLEVIPLAFLRGRSIRNSIIYSMESENLTKEHIQLIMGRVDEGSQLWMDGDLKQRDKEIFEKSRGLEMMIERLSGNPLFGHVHLKKSERSEVARLADLLD